MEGLCSRLSQFQKSHDTWNVYDFYDIQDKYLKNSILNIFKAENDYLYNLITTGNESEITALEEHLKLSAPHLITVVFACILEQLFIFEETEKPFSKDVVTYLRSKGWKFPEFAFEKKLITDTVQSESNQTTE
jgi:hypothetical protein